MKLKQKGQANPKTENGVVKRWLLLAGLCVFYIAQVGEGFVAVYFNRKLLKKHIEKAPVVAATNDWICEFLSQTLPEGSGLLMLRDEMSSGTSGGISSAGSSGSKG